MPASLSQLHHFHDVGLDGLSSLAMLTRSGRWWHARLITSYFGLIDRWPLMEDLMDHFVILDRLPEGLKFPSDLEDRIHIDPETRKLSFRGYMSKADFDRISQLTRDWSFRRKLEELFQVCVPEDDPASKVGHGLFSLFRKRSIPS